jgi:hypothetical protein
MSNSSQRFLDWDCRAVFDLRACKEATIGAHTAGLLMGLAWGIGELAYIHEVAHWGGCI